MKKLLILLFSILISFNSYGEWIKVSESVDGDSYYIDLDTLKERDEYIYWWQMKDYLKPNESETMSDKAYIQGDCELTRTKVLSLIFYEQPMGKGTGESLDSLGVLMDFYNLPLEPFSWMYLPPDSIGAFMLEQSCSLVVKTSEEQQRIIEELQKTNEYQRLLAEEVLEDLAREQKNEEDQLNTLKRTYTNHIAAKVRSYWIYQGAEDGWGCDVSIQQSIEGVVEAVNVQNCTLDDSDKARSFKNSIERAIYKASPFPIAPDESVFDKEVLFFFRVN